ncbi:UDP-2,4-diacetamido-2,4,6-trideoxy-beta-L-altropyranose hydrolase [Candidatus Aerophobetes bacterium]|nr:UDP-2,4-diacetamido-2,4,6-trideoxy-beta-L-altropyranose hydrolase [Candidatus Aerophobetes bacterium]
MNQKIVALIIARMTSTRLPGKGLKDICGRDLLGHIIDRLRKVKSIDEIVLATTNRKEDIPLLEFAKREKIKSFAYDGDKEDVVGRIRKAGEYFSADILVHISGDCPLIHPPTIERLIDALIKNKAEMASIAKKNGKKVIHEGIGVCTLKAWQKVEENSTKSYQRENLVACLLDYPHLLKKVEIDDEPIFYELNHRISVDTQADLNFMRKVYKRLYKPGEIVDLKEAIKLLKREPKLMEINSRVRQKKLQDKSKRILFRMDANQKIGMGHLIRCLALASELQERYFCGISFIIKSSNSVTDMIKERGFKVEILSKNISKEDELSQIEKFVQDYGIDRIILDLKDKIANEYILKLRKLNIPIISIDNDSEEAFFADINIFPVAHFIPDRKWENYKGKLYYGPEYVILRREFQKDYPYPNNSIPNILITMGGSDAENLTGKVLSAILPIPDIHITIILGKFFAHYNKIRQMIRGRNNIIIYQDVTNMAEIMTKADLAVTYFGVTAYELAKMGIPAIVIAHSREDKLNAERFAEHGTCVSLGYCKEVNKEKICSVIRKLLSNKEIRKKMSIRGRELLDGRESERIAKIIINSEERSIVTTGAQN